MGAPIGTIPQGLLGLLALKQMGANPVSLLETVSPNLDITQLYLQRIMQGETQLFGGIPTTVANVSGGFGKVALTVGGVQIAVPQNEMWYLDSATLFATASIASGETIVAAPVMQTSVLSGGSITLLAPVWTDITAARAHQWMSPPITRPVFAAPGTAFFAEILDVLSVGGITLNLAMRAARLPI